jgi:ribosomal protein L11 methyltransferase
MPVMRTWRRLTFSIPEPLAQDLIVCLHEQGTLGVESTSGGLHAWFMEPLDEASLLGSLLAGLPEASGRLHLTRSESVPDGFWHEKWLEGLTPFAVGERFLVVPGPATPARTLGRRVIRLTPGRAFGTGEHATTRMCLAMLENRIRPDEGLLDVGTGSGILAIAGRMLGAEPVVAIDIDPVAVWVAARNAAINDVAGILLAAGGPGIVRAGCAFHRVVANINGVSLIRLMADLAPLSAREVILSGILAEEEGEVVARAGMEGLEVEERSAEGEWVALGMRRRHAL